jgi:PPK2 family polyphosphate:nucleotide phosphotransferase
MIEQLRVVPGTPAGLDARDTSDHLGLGEKERGKSTFKSLEHRLDELHDRLWAEAERTVLLVVQGMDAAGKDGVIRAVLTGLNPQGCSVASFKAPSDIERAHDYLWRVHAAVPPRGHVGAFNRSHYEDVLAARVVGAATAEQCKLRYRHIVEFERLLTDEGTTLVKVFLHLSKDEQRRRFEERLSDPKKVWKFKTGDLEVRAHWDEYQLLYEEVITATSSEHAPWHVVPADHNWVRDVAVATLLVEALERLDPRYPPADPALRDLRVE